MSTTPAKPTATSAPAPSASPGGAAPAAGGAGAGGAAGAPAPVRRVRPRVDWKAVWPIPLALTAAAGLAFGLFTAVAKAPKADPGVPLKLAHAAYDESRYTDALEIINADLVPYINAGKLSEEQEKDFFALRARSLYYGQERMGISQVENYKAITEAYEQGRRRGMVTEPADVGNLAESYLYTGDVEKAVDLARLLEGRDEERRQRLFERIVTQEMKEGSTRYPLVLSLLNDMLLKKDLPVEKRAWAVTRQAQMRLDAGFAQEAITRLLRELPKFESLPKEVRADLLFILGKAYADGVDDQMAMTTLEQAMRCLLEQESVKEGQPQELRIDRFDPRIGEALVIQGRIFARNGQVEEARERFQMVRESFKDSNVYAQALLGEADTSAELSDFDGALALYGQAADRVASAGPTPATPGIAAVTLDLIGAKLMDHHNRRVLENDPTESLHFVRKAQEVYQRLGAVPSNVYLAAAKACRLNAQLLLREAAGTPANEPAPRPEDVSPVTATQAKGYLLDAGQNFLDHVRTVGDNYNAQMESLLAAGDCFDLAGDAAAAIQAYSTFLSGAHGELQGIAEAKYRVAQAYQSTGQFKSAARYYKELIDGGRAGASGKYADMSLVPLARCYVSDPSTVQAPEGAAASNDKANELEAIALLTRAVSGRAGLGPGAAQMRDAQVELAELYYRRGEFREAIEGFNRAVDTYHDQTPRLPTVLFKRADAHRQLAMKIIATFDQRPLAERNELAQAQNTHLRDARAGYQEALTSIAKRGARASKTEKLYQRNAMFYTADCAYLLGQYEQAVQEYARAGEQYASSPASLMAKVQTVSAYIRLSRWDDAQVAAERAKAFLATLQDESWNNPDDLLPMERRHWEAWLAARLELDNHFKTASAGGGPN